MTPTRFPSALAPEPIRLTRHRQGMLYFTLAGLLLTGLAWLILDTWVQVDGPFGPMKHPAEPWMMKLHGAFTMIALVLLGTVLPTHVRKAWALRRNRLAGTALLAIFAVLTATGYALYYFAGEDTRAVISLTHWVIGVALPVGLTWHVIAGKARAVPKEATAPAIEGAGRIEPVLASRHR